MPKIETLILNPNSPELVDIARWRMDTFTWLDRSVEQERRSLETFTSDQREQVAIIAKIAGKPVGTCLLVTSEIEPNHAVAPWLAGLFVVPKFRRQGVGKVLVRGIEYEARKRGASRLHLYTKTAVGYYEGLGWMDCGQTCWQSRRTTFMWRNL